MSDSGFTLVELLVGLAISCIVIVAAYSFVLTGLRSYDMSRKAAELQEETQFIENAIVDAVENGKAASSDISSVTGGGATWTVFDTGYQKVCYDGSGQLALYDLTDSVGSDIKKHLLSGHVTAFNVAYVLDEYETDPSTGAVKTALAAGEKSGLVEVEFEVTLNGKTDRIVKKYKFRNK